jgi:hypothetical protein
MTLFDYLPKEVAATLCKLAEGERKPSNMLREAVGMGIGTLAGGGAAHYGNELYKHVTGNKGGMPIPHLMIAGPVIGAGLGLAYNMSKAHELEEIKRAVESGNHKP